jgi:hypothetical protein
MLKVLALMWMPEGLFVHEKTPCFGKGLIREMRIDIQKKPEVKI